MAAHRWSVLCVTSRMKGARGKSSTRARRCWRTTTTTGSCATKSARRRSSTSARVRRITSAYRRARGRLIRPLRASRIAMLWATPGALRPDPFARRTAGPTASVKRRSARAIRSHRKSLSRRTTAPGRRHPRRAPARPRVSGAALRRGWRGNVPKYRASTPAIVARRMPPLRPRTSRCPGRSSWTASPSNPLR